MLDYNLDTINEEMPFEMDSLFTSNEFKSEGYYTISFENFRALESHITNQDMAQIRIQSGISQMGEMAILKRDFKEPKYQNFKISHVKNINWIAVNSTQICPVISTWGISGREGIEECANATSKNYSYAEMPPQWQLKHSNAIPFEQYMKSVKDSLFVKGYFDDTYVLTYGDLEVDAFHFHDLGIIADLNVDGIGDRATTWYYTDSADVCRTTKKLRIGSILFF